MSIIDKASTDSREWHGALGCDHYRKQSRAESHAKSKSKSSSTVILIPGGDSVRLPDKPSSCSVLADRMSEKGARARKRLPQLRPYSSKAAHAGLLSSVRACPITQRDRLHTHISYEHCKCAQLEGIHHTRARTKPELHAPLTCTYAKYALPCDLFYGSKLDVQWT